MLKICILDTAYNNGLEFHDYESSVQNDLEEIFDYL